MPDPGYGFIVIGRNGLPPMTFDQGEFNFEAGSEDGWRRWREDLDARRRAFEARHGLILGAPVRVQLQHLERELEGRIHLVEDAPRQPGKALRLRIGRHEFSAAEIVSIVRLADGETTS